jgi:hypothetical protein
MVGLLAQTVGPNVERRTDFCVSAGASKKKLQREDVLLVEIQTLTRRLPRGTKSEPRVSVATM